METIGSGVWDAIGVKWQRYGCYASAYFLMESELVDLLKVRLAPRLPLA